LEAKDAMENAFHHLLKTQIGFSEQLSEEILNFMDGMENKGFDAYFMIP
jgi:hypothetical protein